MEAAFWDKIDIVELILLSKPELHHLDIQGNFTHFFENFDQYISIYMYFNIFFRPDCVRNCKK